MNTPAQLAPAAAPAVPQPLAELRAAAAAGWPGAAPVKGWGEGESEGERGMGELGSPFESFHFESFHLLVAKQVRIQTDVTLHTLDFIVAP